MFIETSWREEFSFGNLCFWSFRVVEWKNFCLLLINFRRCCQDCVLVHWNIFGKKIFKKSVLYHYWTLSGKNLAFCRPTFEGVVKTVFSVSIRTLLGETFFQEKTLFIFRIILKVERKSFSFFQRLFNGLAHTAFWMFIETAWWKTIFSRKICYWLFWDKVRNVFGLSVIFFWERCPDCILRVTVKKWKENNFFEELIFFCFRIFREIFSAFHR